jgi:IS30 family transposase
MANSTKLHSLNAIEEWKQPSTWKQVRAYVLSIQEGRPPVFPRGLNDRQMKSFKHKFHKDYEVVGPANNRKLFYRPKDAEGNYRISLQVLEPRPDKIQNALKAIYSSDVKSGWGITLMYYKVCQEYLGITRQTVIDFLKKQESFQLTRPYAHKVNHPIQTKTANQKWMCDSLFVLQYGFDPYNEDERRNVRSVNNHYEHRQLPDEMIGMTSYRYIFTCVDAYSRKVWAEPMLAHSAEETVIALEKIFRDSQTYPACIVTDNGGEFDGVFKILLAAHNIHHIHTTSHSPFGNGIVERMNRTIREKIRQGFIRHGARGSLEWVEHLQDYCDNINNSRSIKLNVTPNQLWSPGYHPRPANRVPEWAEDDIEDTSRLHQIKNHYELQRIHLAREQLSRRPPNIFNVGDVVRIAAERYFNEVRKRNKEDMTKKYNATNWTPEIFQVVTVLGRKPAPDQNLQQMGIKAWDLREQKYILKHLEPPQNLLKREFYGSELQLVKPGTRYTQISNARSRELNRFIAYT